MSRTLDVLALTGIVRPVNTICEAPALVASTDEPSLILTAETTEGSAIVIVASTIT